MGNEHSSSGYQNAVVLQQDDSLWKIEKVDKDPPVCLFTSIIELEKCKEGLKVGHTHTICATIYHILNDIVHSTDLLYLFVI